jgi:AcrR family transcriptional regulator
MNTSPSASGQPSTVSLPLVQEPPRERADAARNRARLLEAAAALVAERGAENVTMEAVASAASVGKGTVFRRFGDRLGLMVALLDRAEREFQHDFLFGPPPLGPGAPPARRLHEFGGATIRWEVRNVELSLAAERDPERRYLVPARTLRLMHVLMLLRGAGAAGDHELLAEALLGFLEPAVVNHLHTQRGMSVARLTAGWSELVDRVLGARA